MIEMIEALRRQIEKLSDSGVPKVEMFWLQNDTSVEDVAAVYLKPYPYAPQPDYRVYLELPFIYDNFNRIMHITLSPDWETVPTTEFTKTSIMVRAAPDLNEGPDRIPIKCSNGEGLKVRLPYKMTYVAYWDGGQWHIPDAIVEGD